MLEEVLEEGEEANHPGYLQSGDASFQHGRERPIDAHPVGRREQAARPKRNRFVDLGNDCGIEDENGSWKGGGGRFSPSSDGSRPRSQETV